MMVRGAVSVQSAGNACSLLRKGPHIKRELGKTGKALAARKAPNPKRGWSMKKGESPKGDFKGLRTQRRKDLSS